MKSFFLLTALASLLTASHALATSNYEYGRDEYVTINNGLSPDGKYAITAHGGGEMGYDDFHLYLTDAASGRKIGPLEEAAGDALDTGANAITAIWSRDSTQVTIIWRVDRHAPLLAMHYRLSKGRAIPAGKACRDAIDAEVIEWGKDHHTQKTFGTPLPKKDGDR